MTRALRASWRIAAMAAWTLVSVAVFGGARLFSARPAASVPRLWHRGVCRIAGIDRVVHGRPVQDRPVVFVSNHVSYLDIVVLGGLLPGSFVAKADVSAWPVIGWLAGLQDTLFIERRPARAALQQIAMRQRLTDGKSLILFPEGTSSDGSGVLPFRSALFQAAAPGEGILVQPVSLGYTRLNGRKLDTTHRPFVGWYGDMGLWPHLLRFLGLGRLQAEIEVHAPLRPEDFASRKALAERCRDIVAAGLAGTARPVGDGGGSDRSPHRPAQAPGCPDARWSCDNACILRAVWPGRRMVVTNPSSNCCTAFTRFL